MWLVELAWAGHLPFLNLERQRITSGGETSTIRSPLAVSNGHCTAQAVLALQHEPPE